MVNVGQPSTIHVGYQVLEGDELSQYQDNELGELIDVIIEKTSGLRIVHRFFDNRIHLLEYIFRNKVKDLTMTTFFDTPGLRKYLQENNIPLSQIISVVEVTDQEVSQILGNSKDLFSFPGKLSPEDMFPTVMINPRSQGGVLAYFRRMIMNVYDRLDKYFYLVETHQQAVEVIKKFKETVIDWHF